MRLVRKVRQELALERLGLSDPLGVGTVRLEVTGSRETPVPVFLDPAAEGDQPDIFFDLRESGLELGGLFRRRRTRAATGAAEK